MQNIQSATMLTTVQSNYVNFQQDCFKNVWNDHKKKHKKSGNLIMVNYSISSSIGCQLVSTLNYVRFETTRKLSHIVMFGGITVPQNQIAAKP